MRALVLSLALSIPLIAVASHPREALAQDDVAELKARFKEALALENEGKWDEALGLFITIAEKRRSPQVVFHIALCQEETGRLKSALDTFEEALSLAKADPKAATEVLENTPPRIEALKGRVPRIVLVPGGEPRTVIIDGKQLAPVTEEIEIAVDPGRHRISAREDDGGETSIRSVDMREGQTIRVEVAKKGAGGAKGAGGTEPSPPPPVDAAQVEPGNLLPGIVVGGVGVASLIASGVFIGLRQAAISEVRDGCSNGDSGCDPALQDVADRGQSYEYAAIGLGAAGLAAVGVGVALVFTIGQDRTVAAQPKAQSRLFLSPMGIRFEGTFE
jgi:hypothetical protein